MIIKPLTAPIEGSHLCGHLSPRRTVKSITAVLGFSPDHGDDHGKTNYEWRFEVDGVPCRIWDFKHTRWSVFGPDELMAKLFEDYVPFRGWKQ